MSQDPSKTLNHHKMAKNTLHLTTLEHGKIRYKLFYKLARIVMRKYNNRSDPNFDFKNNTLRVKKYFFFLRYFSWSHHVYFLSQIFLVFLTIFLNNYGIDQEKSIQKASPKSFKSLTKPLFKENGAKIKLLKSSLAGTILFSCFSLSQISIVFMQQTKKLSPQSSRSSMLWASVKNFNNSKWIATGFLSPFHFLI